jgi:hypothetical protein
MVFIGCFGGLRNNFISHGRVQGDPGKKGSSESSDAISSEDITSKGNPQYLRSSEKQSINFISNLKQPQHKSS